jgi:hypothetical protein
VGSINILKYSDKKTRKDIILFLKKAKKEEIKIYVGK